MKDDRGQRTEDEFPFCRPLSVVCLLAAAASLLLTEPAKAGLLNELREARAQQEQAKTSAKTRKALRNKQRRPVQDSADDTYAYETSPRFGVQPEPRRIRRGAPQAEPASWAGEEKDRWAARRGWVLPEDKQTPKPEPVEAAPVESRWAALEPQPQIDPVIAEHQQWEENLDGWIDTDAGTRPIPREEVTLETKEAPGTILINTPERRLYFILGDNRAVQYGIGVGKPGFEWAGVKTVTRKEEWPDWRPPEMMIRRRPDLPRFMPGGPTNPLGARAMYLGGSLYRIHGSNEPETIGQAVSSGCIRMINADVIDLYNRAQVGTKVVVR